MREDDRSVREDGCVCGTVPSAIVCLCKGRRCHGFFLFCFCFAVAQPTRLEAQAPAASGANDCLRLSATKIDWGDRDVADKHRKLWLETCKQAYAQNGDDPHIKVALAGAMTDRNEFIPLLRSAIAQNDTEAMLLLFNDYNSFDRHLTGRTLSRAPRPSRRCAALPSSAIPMRCSGSPRF